MLFLSSNIKCFSARLTLLFYANDDVSFSLITHSIAFLPLINSDPLIRRCSDLAMTMGNSKGVKCSKALGCG